MNPWFPEHYSWIFGTTIGVGGGIFGMLLGTLGPQGKAKSLVFGIYWLLLITSAVLLVAGLIAWFAGQPYGVWYGLGLGGLIGTLVLGLNYKTMTNVYRRAEERKLTAQNL
jgi:hypothetical protein